METEESSLRKDEVPVAPCEDSEELTQNQSSESADGNTHIAVCLMGFMISLALACGLANIGLACYYFFFQEDHVIHGLNTMTSIFTFFAQALSHYVIDLNCHGCPRSCSSKLLLCSNNAGAKQVDSFWKMKKMLCWMSICCQLFAYCVSALNIVMIASNRYVVFCAIWCPLSFANGVVQRIFFSRLECFLAKVWFVKAGMIRLYGLRDLLVFKIPTSCQL